MNASERVRVLRQELIVVSKEIRGLMAKRLAIWRQLRDARLDELRELHDKLMAELDVVHKEDAEG